MHPKTKNVPFCEINDFAISQHLVETHEGLRVILCLFTYFGETLPTFYTYAISQGRIIQVFIIIQQQWLACMNLIYFIFLIKVVDLGMWSMEQIWDKS